MEQNSSRQPVRREVESGAPRRGDTAEGSSQLLDQSADRIRHLARTILAINQSGESAVTLAARHKCAKSTIYSVINGSRWAWLTRQMR